MALEIIGAGFGRTGTESLKTALGLLGYGRCHHMVEVLPRQEQMDFWRDVARGNEKPNWDVAFKGFNASLDWPSAFYWRQLSEYYPSAKVILSVRDPEAWYESFKKTILRHIHVSDDPKSLGQLLIRDRVFAGDLVDKDHIIAIYKKNIADVQATLPGSRLLTYPVGSGWEPLCDFLDKPVPDEPYPWINKAEYFLEKIKLCIDSRRESRASSPAAVGS